MQLKTSTAEAIGRLRGIVGAIRSEIAGEQDPAEGEKPELVRRLASYPISEVGPNATLADVVEQLVRHDVSIVVVVADGQVTGLVSERDIIDAVSDGAELATVWAADVMATDLEWIDRDDTVADAASRMLDTHLRHLLVTADGSDGPAVVSIRDVLSALVANRQN